MRVCVFIFVFFVVNKSYPQGYAYDHFELGEKLHYKIKYGWFKVGEAEVSIDNKLHTFDNQEHFLIAFKLETVGWLKIFANIYLDFQSFINSKSFQPHHSRRITINGRKSDSQFDEFYYLPDSIRVKTYRKEKDEFKTSIFEKAGPHFTDALGTYFCTRAKELSKREVSRLYIANRFYYFNLKAEDTYSDKKSSKYELFLPQIKQFPRERKSYAILSKNTNIPLEIKLSTRDGNFFFILKESP